jgi:hypothetical protein
MAAGSRRLGRPFWKGSHAGDTARQDHLVQIHCAFRSCFPRLCRPLISGEGILARQDRDLASPHEARGGDWSSGDIDIEKAIARFGQYRIACAARDERPAHGDEPGAGGEHRRIVSSDRGVFPRCEQCGIRIMHAAVDLDAGAEAGTPGPGRGDGTEDGVRWRQRRETAGPSAPHGERGSTAIIRPPQIRVAAEARHLRGGDPRQRPRPVLRPWDDLRRLDVADSRGFLPMKLHAEIQSGG